MKARYTGMSMPRINVAHARAVPIAVPPLAEQSRIVAKVTELLSLCDTLEARLAQAESVSTQLLSAAVHHLLTEATSWELQRRDQSGEGKCMSVGRAT